VSLKLAAAQAIRSFGKLLLRPSLLQSKLTDSLAQALLG
jgi:hypothetical protein